MKRLPAWLADQIDKRTADHALAWLTARGIAPAPSGVREAMDANYHGGWGQFLADHDIPRTGSN